MKKVLSAVSILLFATLTLFGSAAEAQISSPQKPLGSDSLYERGRATVPLADDILIVPYKSFMAAVGADSKFEQAAGSYIDRSIDLNADANSPTVLGAMANYDEKLTSKGEIEPQSFQGSIFIVPLNPHFNRDATEIEFTKFFIATVATSGTAPWTGSFARLSTTGESLGGGGLHPDCCETGSNQRQCGGFNGEGGGIGPGFCLSASNCPWTIEQKFLDTKIWDNPAIQFGRGIEVAGDEHSPFGKSWQHLNGEPITPMYVFQSRHAYDSSDFGEYGLEILPGLGCTTCQQTLPDPEACLAESSGDPLESPPVDHPCGGRKNVSDHCKRIGPMSELGAGCFGHNTYADKNVAHCLGTGSTGGVVDSNSHWSPGATNGVAGLCKSNSPDICQRIMPSNPYSGICNPETISEKSTTFDDLLMCGSTSPAPVGASGDMTECCGNNCGCRLVGGDTELCTDCDSDGNCKTTYRPAWETQFQDANDDDDDSNDDDESDEEKEGADTEQAGSFEYNMEPMFFGAPTNTGDNTSVKQNDTDTISAQHQTPTPTRETPEESASGTDEGGNSPTAGMPTFPSVEQRRKEIVGSSGGGSGGGSSTTNQGGDNDKNTGGRQTGGDPVVLGSGRLDLKTTDLRFPGPKRPLEFVRTYDSGNNHRGILGSNWTHNFEVFLEVVKPATAPRWVPEYCVGWAPEETCLLFHEGNGNVSLFLWDPKSQVFAPQAGRTETIIRKRDHYAMRAANGHLLIFNERGYLVEDRDRFGNGFSVEYEFTPLFLLYKRYCTRIKNADDSFSFFGSDPEFDPRACSVLAHIYRDQAMEPMDADIGWGSNSITLPGDDLGTQGFGPKPWEDPIRSGSGYEDAIRAARIYFRGLLDTGFFPQELTGLLRMRPVRVVDDLGRELEFVYHGLPSGATSVSFPSTFGLVKEVRGPVNSRLYFEYDRPADFPARQNEMFLTRVKRSTFGQAPGDIDDWQWDASESQGKPREYVYTYQWPSEVDGTTFKSYQDYDSTYRNAYADYFGAYIGCMTVGQVFCGPFGGQSLKNGNPCFQAELERQRYVTAVADNIIRVTRSGDVEAESRFIADPYESSFDRVVEQRYGGSEIQASGAWASGYPDFTINYFSTGSSFNISTLPFEEGRYVKEDLVGQSDEVMECVAENADHVYPDGTPCVDTGETNSDLATTLSCDWSGTSLSERTDGSSRLPCSVEGAEAARKNLPGHQSVYDYFDQDYAPIDASTQLKTSQLTCAQLAVAQLSDPTHNDVLAELIPDATTAELHDHVMRRLVGGRERVEMNSRRICRWVQVIDRNDDESWFGLNYRGETLVHAIREPNQSTDEFIYSEMFYNADGNLIHERKPVRGGLQTAPGHSYYTYDEIDPTANGGDDGLQFAFWARRKNLLEERHISAVSVLDIEMQKVLIPEDDTATGSAERFVEYSYEPLFNQLHEVLWGHVESGGLRKQDYRVVYEFDYQEFGLDGPLDPATDPLGAALVSLIRWGLVPPLMSDANGDLTSQLDHEGVQWHVPLPFYGGDLNGDQDIGFRNNGTHLANKVKGVPVRILHENPNDTSTRRFTHIAWAPHGRPAAIRGPSGATTWLSYYPREATGYSTNAAIFGVDTEPSDAAVSSQFKGLLARVEVAHYVPTYPASEGPAAPCQELPGPYQWLIPDCGSSTSIETQLLDLGLASTAVNEIMRAADSTTDRLKTSFSYNQSGHRRYQWNNGEPTHTIRDSDGRLIQKFDPLGNETYVFYNHRGWPVHLDMYEMVGGTSRELIGQEDRRYDNEGNLLASCTALEAGACNNVLDGSNTVGTASGPNYLLEVSSYNGEGRLTAHSDPTGATTYYLRNARGLVDQVLRFDPNGIEDHREVNYRFNDLSQLVGIDYGSAATRTQYGGRSKDFTYDGFGRLVRYNDLRGRNWQLAYTATGELVRAKQSATPYSLSAPTASGSEYELAFGYNPHGERVMRATEGVVTETLERGLGGRVYQQDQIGSGTRYFTYDATGNVVWSRDAAGNQAVRTSNAVSRYATVSSLRSDLDGDFLTTSAISTYSPLGDLIAQTTIGHGDGETLTTSYLRDGLGRLVELTEPTGQKTSYDRNFTGWVKSEQVEKSASGALATTMFTHDARGQVRTVTDPAGETTTYTYNGFGQLDMLDTPGAATVEKTFSYDGYGRLETLTLGDGHQMGFLYDTATGDLASEHWLTAPGWATQQVLREYAYDSRGRLRQATNYNVPLEQFGYDVSKVWTNREYQYDIFDRVSSEILEIGTATQKQVTRSYQLDGDTWRAEVTYPSLTGTSELYDTSGRLDAITRWGTNEQRHIDFHWIGGLYAGRDQDWTSDLSIDPIREFAEFDGLGRRLGWEYTAVDLDQDGDPVRPQWADTYCGESYNPGRCSEPLLEIDVLRDVGGRIASKTSRFGHPMFESDGTPIEDDHHDYRWRGWEYDHRQHLVKSWEFEGPTLEVNPSIASNHSIDNADVQAIAGSVADPWAYDRDWDIGSLEGVQNPDSGVYRWQTASPRTSGHKLDQVTVDQTTYAMSHDPIGRVDHALDLDFTWSPRGQLVAAESTNTTAAEYYIYDAAGRIVGVMDGTGNDRFFVHDGEQIIAEYDAEENLQWEAVWGPGLDRLVEWTDYTTSGQAHVPLLDERRSVVASWDAKLMEIDQIAEYDPHGRVALLDHDEATACAESGNPGQVCPNPSGIPFGFVGALRSELSGMVYMRNRWYSPRLAQFLSHDPLGYVDSYNPYAYVAFDPVNGWDPYGTCSIFGSVSGNCDMGPDDGIDAALIGTMADHPTVGKYVYLAEVSYRVGLLSNGGVGEYKRFLSKQRVERSKRMMRHIPAAESLANGDVGGAVGSYRQKYSSGGEALDNAEDFNDFLWEFNLPNDAGIRHVHINQFNGNLFNDVMADNVPNADTQRTYDTTKGSRRVDIFDPRSGRAIETKIGPRKLSETKVKEQVEKDVLLLNDPANDVNSIEWWFGPSPHSSKNVRGQAGPDSALRNKLLESGIGIRIFDKNGRQTSHTPAKSFVN